MAYQADLFHLLEAYQEVDLILVARPFQVAYSYLVVHFEEIFLVNLVVDHPCPEVHSCLMDHPCPEVHSYLEDHPCLEAPCLVDQN